MEDRYHYMKKIPHITIAQLPTPVESLPRLSAQLGGPTLLVKRDDQTGLAFGGNKTRKLEYLLAEAEAAGARTVITAGKPRQQRLATVSDASWYSPGSLPK